MSDGEIKTTASPPPTTQTRCRRQQVAQQLSGIQTNTHSFDPRHEQVRVAFQAAEEGFATLVVFGPDGGWLLSLGEARIHRGANTLTWMGHDSEDVPVSNGK